MAPESFAFKPEENWEQHKSASSPVNFTNKCQVIKKKTLDLSYHLGSGNTEYCNPMNWTTGKEVWPLLEDREYLRPVNMWGPPKWRPANMWGTPSTRGLMLLYRPSCEGLGSGILHVSHIGQIWYIQGFSTSSIPWLIKSPSFTLTTYGHFI